MISVSGLQFSTLNPSLSIPFNKFTPPQQHWSPFLYEHLCLQIPPPATHFQNALYLPSQAWGNRLEMSIFCTRGDGPYISACSIRETLIFLVQNLNTLIQGKFFHLPSGNFAYMCFLVTMGSIILPVSVHSVDIFCVK